MHRVAQIKTRSCRGSEIELGLHPRDRNVIPDLPRPLPRWHTDDTDQHYLVLEIS